ncbi:hypothetical protein ACLIA0_06155 [Bacillaceae bacterium W0354]
MEKRIAYYTKKVSHYTAIHPAKRRNPYRFQRLMNYKHEMNRRLREVN